MRASLHAPVEVFVAVVDNVVEAEKLSEGDLDTVNDDEAALVSVTDADSDFEPLAVTDGLLESVTSADTDADSDLLFVTDADSDRLSVPDADSDRLIVLESDSDRERVRDGETLLVSVTSADTDADTLRLTLDVCVSDGSTDAEAVSDGVKLGDTGLIVTEGVMDGVGKNIVYETKNADPPDAILIISAPVMPPPLSKNSICQILVCCIVPTADDEKSI